MVHNYLPVPCRNTLTATKRKSTSRTVFLCMIYGMYSILIFRISVSECGYQRDALSLFILALENNCMWGIFSQKITYKLTQPEHTMLFAGMLWKAITG